MKRNNSYSDYFIIPFLLLLVTGFVSCKHDDLLIQQENKNYRPAIDFIRNNYDLTLFYAAIQRAGMEEELSGAGPFTLLAPGNTAFNEIGVQRPSDFDNMNVDSLRYALRYHILNRRLMINDIPVNGVDVRYATLAGPELYASRISEPGTNEPYFNGCKVSTQDVILTNGALQVLDKVMKYKAGPVQETLLSHPEYSIFVSALKKFGLWDQLATAGPWTVFAPGNDVFEAQGLNAETVAAMDTAAYIGARLFGAYVLRNRHYFLSDLKIFYFVNDEFDLYLQVPDDTHYLKIGWESNYMTNLSEYTLGVWTARDAPTVELHRVRIVRQALMDYSGDNGVVHDIPGLLVLPEDAKK